MKPQLIHHVRVFLEVAKLGSFTAAADVLEMQKSSTSRSVTALEKELGVKLINRTTRTLVLTEEGRHYFEQCSRGMHEIVMATQLAQTAPASARGHLRVAAPPDFTVRFTAEKVREFLDRYPNVTMDLHFTPKWMDPLAERYDVTVRMGELPDSSLVIRRLGELPRRLYASPDYLARHGTPRAPAELTTHQCVLRSERGSDQIERQWTLRASRRSVNVDVQGRTAVNNVGFIRNLAVAGVGVAVMADAFADPDVEAGSLVPVLSNWSAASLPVYAVTVSQLLPAKTRALLDFLSELLAPMRR
ncbi:LysR family transcriptional regulator [Pigmentiphaga litoralis]|uniref:LysR family transcriptional regulator n=1 Tax=Pigmentiphaga litoralis TaxID=516702 RepID=UPI001671D195|nr:LysR family transcriptional regulator [Pigmentiphaga litoralis]GGX19259.1 LysR family transcriptional regulator [Pigmentiphaga litoralis]